MSFISRINQSVLVFLLLAFLGVSMASEQTMIPSLPKVGTQNESLLKSKEVKYDLVPYLMESSVDNQDDAWRGYVAAGNKGELSLQLITGSRRSSPKSKSSSEVWASYDFDWNRLISRGQTVRFTYVFGNSSAGLRSNFRFGATDESRKSISGDYALSLVYADTECTFKIQDQASSGQLPRPIQDGTTVVVEITPAKKVKITIDDNLILDDQYVEMVECYFTISATSENMENPLMTRELNFDRITVDVE